MEINPQKKYIDRIYNQIVDNLKNSSRLIYDPNHEKER